MERAVFGLEWECAIDIPLSNGNYPSEPQQSSEPAESLILDACKTYGSSFDFTVNIHGENISFEDYKLIVYKAVHILQLEMDNRPTSLQVFYYRNNNGGEEVMQYESYLQTYQFDLTEQGVLTAENVHKYVEVPADIQKKADIYYIVKNVVTIVIAVTVVALSALWCVRKYRKHKRYKKGAAVLEDNKQNLE